MTLQVNIQFEKIILPPCEFTVDLKMQKGAVNV